LSNVSNPIKSTPRNLIAGILSLTPLSQQTELADNEQETNQLSRAAGSQQCEHVVKKGQKGIRESYPSGSDRIVTDLIP